MSSPIVSRATVREAVAARLEANPSADTADTLQAVADALALPIEAVHECVEPSEVD